MVKERICERRIEYLYGYCDRCGGEYGYIPDRQEDCPWVGRYTHACKSCGNIAYLPKRYPQVLSTRLTFKSIDIEVVGG